jgi:Flp pilus assembly protein TadD
MSSGKEIGTVRFICVNCGMANEIDIDLKTATTLLERLSSDDPAVRDAIDRAKGGDYGAALDIARKKLGF